MLDGPEQGQGASQEKAATLGSAEAAESLVGALRDAGGDQIASVALLWTWLERHLLALGSLRRKAPTIRAEALSSPLRNLHESDLAGLREAPLLTAATLLARIHHGLAAESPAALAVEAIGIGGQRVLVMWRSPALARRLGPDTDMPPPSLEHPALAALAPRLVVSPIEHGGIAVRVADQSGDDWGRVNRELERSLSVDGPGLEIHLDALGARGLPELRRELDEAEAEPRTGIAWLCADPATEDDAGHAVRDAVARACGDTPSLLLMPELAVSDATLAILKEELSRRDEEEPGATPALTVVGRLHMPIDAAQVPPAPDALAGTAEVAGHVNEAVVLGPDGTELWSHRKLSSAQVATADGAVVVEDVQLGTELVIAPTPIGTVTVVVCLDAFASHVRDRLVSSPADLLLVPSLSPKVKRHRTALGELVQRLWGVAFVCNRALPEGDETGWNELRNRSFWAIQRSEVCIPDEKGDGEPPSFTVRIRTEI